MRRSFLILVAMFLVGGCSGAPPPETQGTPIATSALSLAQLPTGSVSAAQAAAHVSEIAKVCGLVVSATYAESSAGSPTFLDLDKPYPNAVFTIVIWEEDRAFYGGHPEVKFAKSRVCIEGLVESYRGKPQIVADGESIELIR